MEGLINDKTNQAFWYNDEILPLLDKMYGKFTKDPSSIYKKIICENMWIKTIFIFINIKPLKIVVNFFSLIFVDYFWASKDLNFGDSTK